MGTVHKLKPEIIDFIVEQKTQDSTLSCRALESIVKDHFQQKVSKSSISNILKQANLSSPPGRPHVASHSAKPKTKKFLLPETKKKNLFSDASEHVILSDLKKEAAGEGFIDGAGCIFLKAAEWEMSRKPVFYELLKDYCSLSDEHKVKQVAATISLLKAFHGESFEDIARYQGKGLWAMNDIEKRLGAEDVAAVVESFHNPEEFLLNFSLKSPQIFTEIAGFRFLLNDGSVFFIDGQKQGVWKNVQKTFPVSLLKATDMLAEILNNVQSVVLSASSCKNISKKDKNTHFFEFFGALENVQSKRIVKVELIDESGTVLGDFDEVPQIKRGFIAGAWPWDELFQQFLDVRKVEREGKISRDAAGRDLVFKEVFLKESISGKQFKCRGVLLYEPFARLPLVVLISNIPEKSLDAEALVLRYLNEWSNMEKGAGLSLLSQPQVLNKEPPAGKEDMGNLMFKKSQGKDFLGLAADQVLAALDQSARKQFFSHEYWDEDFYTMRHRFYSLPGRVIDEQNDGKRIIEFSFEKNFPYKKGLHFAVIKFNETAIKDFKQRPIFLTIKN